MRCLLWALALPLGVGCAERQDPPGVKPERTAASQVVLAGSAAPAGGRSATRAAPAEAGSIDDNAPFEPTGTKLASTAWRTWVYTDVGPKRTRYGYLRAGAVVDARGPQIKNEGCQGGWFRINPRGFVCIGKGAALELESPVVQIASVRPTRGQGLPYLYALASDTPPFYYFRFPKPDEMQMVEGEGVFGHVARFAERLKWQGLAGVVGEPSAPPEHLAKARELVKPYGAHERLHYSVHSGRSAPDSGFAIAQVFTHAGRMFGLTTEHDLVALDRTRIVRPSEFHGVELAADENLPVGFVTTRGAAKFVADAQGVLRGDGGFQYREAVKLTGRKQQALLETRDGQFVAEEALRLIAPRASMPSFATGTRKWIDISINQQSLVAYVGVRPVYATLVSTGRGGLGDPETQFATIRGTFMIHTKHVSATMDGDDDMSDSYNLLDVPFVQYFHKGFALHGTYWHDEFGKIRSHGCVNLAPIDAAWLFEWTDPVVPPEWHGVINLERGTVVHVRP